MAKKRLNKTLILVVSLFFSFAMIASAALMLKHLQQSDPGQLAALAQEAAEREDWATASRFFRKAWSRSKNASYLVRQGQMALNASEVDLAIRCWQEASVAQPDLIEAHLKLVKLSLDRGRLYASVQHWLAVRDAAENLLKAQSDKTPAQSAVGHHAKGMALVNLASQDESYPALGIVELEEAVSLAPGDIVVQVDLCKELIRQGQTAAGEERLLQLAADHMSVGAAASKVRLALANYLSDEKKATEAQTYYQEAVALAGDDAESLLDSKLGYATFLLRKWDRARRKDSSSDAAATFFAEAERILRQAIEDNPDAFEPAIRLSRLCQAANRHAEAVEIGEARLSRGFLRRGIEAEKNRLAFFQLNLLASASCVAVAMVEEDREKKDGWFNRAEQYLEDAKGESPNHPRALSQEGRIRLAQGRDREALEALRAADDRYPAYDFINWADKKTLAQLHLRLNEPGEAKAVLEAVEDRARKTRGGDLAFWNIYARVLLLNDDPDRCIDIVEQVLSKDADNAQARLLKAAAHERKGEHQQAAEGMSAPIRAILTYKRLMLEGDESAAEAVLVSALDEHPADYRLVSARVADLSGRERMEEAEAILERAISADPESVKLKALSVLVQPNLSDEERDRRLIEIMEAEEDAYRRTLDFIAFYMRKENLTKALTLINEAERLLIEKVSPLAQTASIAHHRAMLLEKLRVAGLLKDEQAMAEARDAAVEYNVDGAEGQSLVGVYHMYHEEWASAIQAFKTALEGQPTDARSLAQLGQCLIMAGDQAEAKAPLEKAVRINPNEARAHRSLGELARRRGDLKTFEQHLAICEKLIPSDPWVRAGVDARLDRTDPVAAIARRETILNDDPKDANNLLRLAMLCEQADERSKADGYFGRLLQLAPDDKDSVVAVSNYYRRTQRPDKAFSMVRRYAESRTTDEDRANAAMLLAQQYVYDRQLDRAEEVLLDASDQALTLELARGLAEFYYHGTDRTQEALAWYDRAVELADAADDETILAVMTDRINCLLHRNIGDLDRARAQLDELKSRFPQYQRAWLLEGEIHARGGDIDRAIRALSRYLNQSPHDTSALFLRGQHHLAQGDTTAAIEDLRAIKRDDRLALGLRPRILLARLHHQNGDKHLWLAELESLVEEAPSSLDAVNELARAYIAEERLEDADRLVTAQINQSAGEPDARWLALRGRISYELKDFDKALTDYLESARLSGDRATDIAAVLDVYVRAERYEDGLAYHSKHAAIVAESALLMSRYALLLAKSDKENDAAGAFCDAMILASEDNAQTVGEVVGYALRAFGREGAVERFSETRSSTAKERARQMVVVRLLATMGQYDPALVMADRLLAASDSDANRARCLEERGLILDAMGRPGEARTAYERAIQYDQDQWILLNNLAFLLSDQLGLHAEARPYAERAVALAESTHTLDTLGWILVGLGDYSHGIAELNRAIRLDPDAAESYYHLGEAFRRSGEFDKARSILRRGSSISQVLGAENVKALIDIALDKVTSKDISP